MNTPRETSDLRLVPASESHATDSHRYQLPHSSAAASMARRETRAALEDWGMSEEEIYDALLVVSELVTNSTEHALPPVVLELHLLPGEAQVSVGIKVTDGGPTTQEGTWTRSCGSDEHGRGTLVIDAITTEPSGVFAIHEHWEARQSAHHLDAAEHRCTGVCKAFGSYKIFVAGDRSGAVVS
ncbi:ATP-binding protein [Streptomyces sp. NPDC019396]|uniref:ATP-binding protein n=1 Tax=Streptomyces sp. NPDC019396 TaxID=3154687 RepID=UPI0033FC1FA1